MIPVTGILSGALAASVAVSGGLYLITRAQKAEIAAARLEITTLQEANASGREAVARLEAERDQLAERLDEQREREAAIRRESRERLAAVSGLAREDEDVAAFVDRRTPAELCRLHAPAGRESDCEDGDGSD